MLGSDLGLSYRAAQRLRPAFLAGVITDRLAQRAGFKEEFGVGAGHLVGKNGLIATLRRRGYRVKEL